MVHVPFRFFALGIGIVLGCGPGFGVHIAHVLLVLRSTYRIGAPTAADLP